MTPPPSMPASPPGAATANTAGDGDGNVDGNVDGSAPTALLVYCHPLEDSFCAAVRDQVRETLRGAGWRVDLWDLYGEGFNPVLTPEDRRLYHSIPDNQGPVRADLARIEGARALICVYPVWSMGLPAMLKGWFDRLMLPGHAFAITGGRIAPNLTHLRLFGGVMTYGQTWWRITLAGQPVKRTMMRAYAWMAGRDVQRVWLPLYDMNTCTDADRRAFLARVEQRLGAQARAALPAAASATPQPHAPAPAASRVGA